MPFSRAAKEKQKAKDAQKKAVKVRTYMLLTLVRPKKKTCPFPISYRPCLITCYSKVFLGV